MKNIYIVDLHKDVSNINQYISNTLLQHMKKTFGEGKKVLLYINKRGAFDLLLCQDCQYIYKCPKCDVAYSVHHHPDRLMCHHCMDVQEFPSRCHKCNGTHLKKIGVGTQQIEDTMRKIFPSQSLYRFDRDNLKNISLKKEAFQQIDISDIIIGTKMITTGFDFKNIGVIGIVLLEQELQSQNYDAEEKVYSNIKQLIGRGGRLGQNTDIIIQTFSPENSFIQNVTNLNYKEFFIKTLQERKLFGYPPFFELAYLRFKHTQKEKCLLYMQSLYEELQKYNHEKKYEILFSNECFKRDNQYFAKIVIKGGDIRTFLSPVKKEIFTHPDLVVVFEPTF